LAAEPTDIEFLEQFPDPCEVVSPASILAARAAALSAPHRSTTRLGVKPPLVIKVRFASNESSFARGMVIRDLRCRWAAAACDAGMLMFVAVAMFLMLNSFWSSFAISAVCYYLASVVILGNTPGICLCAPRDQARRGEVAGSSMPRTPTAARPIAST